MGIQIWLSEILNWLADCLKDWFVSGVLPIIFLFSQTAMALERNVPNLPDQLYDYRTDFVVAGRLEGYDTLAKVNPITNAGATLGRVLFYDRTLSRNRLVRCASCHTQADGFDDPNRFSIGFEGKVTSRHSMGLANARFNWNNRYFWDERVETLEKQVLQPIFDPIEMGMTQNLLLEVVADQQYYAPLFEAAFGDRSISSERIANALAQFVRSMVSTSSRFDRARDKAGSLTEPFGDFTELENRGKFLFFTPFEKAGAGCSQCHETELFLMRQPTNNGLVLDEPDDRENFRAASLRNINVRAPYMHDGRFETLKQVMDHYGGGIKTSKNLDSKLRDSDGRAKTLIGDEKDKSALIAFLNTLTDREFLNDVRFSDPFAN